MARQILFAIYGQIFCSEPQLLTRQLLAPQTVVFYILVYGTLHV